MRKADDLPPSCALVTKSVNINFLEQSGNLRACNGTALPFLLQLHIHQVILLISLNVQEHKYDCDVLKVELKTGFEYTLLPTDVLLRASGMFRVGTGWGENTSMRE